MFADDEVVMNGDVDCLAGRDDTFRHQNVIVAWRWIARGMVMQLSAHLIHHIDK